MNWELEDFSFTYYWTICRIFQGYRRF